MFDRIAGHAPAAELVDIHRIHDLEERRAWAALRAGEPERAMAHYQARGQLYFMDTRDEAGEAPCNAGSLSPNTTTFARSR